MPPSSSPETISSASNYRSPEQALSKTPAGSQITTKKTRKNGVSKDTATGISAAVKSASKASNKSSPLSGQEPTPPTSDMEPADFTEGGRTVKSPLLDALSSNAFNTAAGQITSEWAKNNMAYSSSPGNLISLGDSPPTFQSSYDNERSSSYARQQRERVIPIPTSHYSSQSPPSARRRPLSFQMDGHPLSEGNPQNSSYRPRRSSMYSPPQRFASNPPLPHHPQAHFYGAPEPIFGAPTHSPGLKPGSRGYYCGFDNLRASKPGESKHFETVIVSGYEGGLDVYGLGRNGYDKVAYIDGLRGGVYNAKILPWTHTGQEGFPLIAIVVHGPILTNESSTGDYGIPRASEATIVPITESSRNSPQEFPASVHDSNIDEITHYQTTVEVYSLKTRKLVTTLLSLPKTQLVIPFSSSLFEPPAPTGALSISADAGNVAVSSGTTGEVWIFHHSVSSIDSDWVFNCIGKLWTTVQQNRGREPTSPPDGAPAEHFYPDHKTAQTTRGGHFAMQGRWLAYSPSASASQISLRASVPGSNPTLRIPGMNTYAPPQLPQVNCLVDTPDEETLLSRVLRTGTQEVIKTATWLGVQGKQAWKSYWNKPSGTNWNNSPGHTWQGQSPPEYGNQFPPTHGESVAYNSPTVEPTLISILDLDRLANVNTSSANNLHPLVTFKANLGCSFMSFSPSGLALFTASSKGDVQFVWDLFRIQYTKSSMAQLKPANGPQGPHVRQIAVFTRMTVARIVDVVWTTPFGERIAMITERNTVHFLDLPASAFAWPAARRKIKAPQPATSSSETTETPKSAASIASNASRAAVGAIWNVAQPLVSQPRNFGSSHRPAISAASMSAHAGHGGKVLATGFSKSIGAATGTIRDFRESGGNKLHLPQSSNVLSTNCIKWLPAAHGDLLAALADGVIKIYTVTQKSSKSTPGKSRMSISNRPIEFRLPLLSDHRFAPSVMRAMDIDDDLDLLEKGDEAAVWRLGGTSVVKADAALGVESSIPQAEIESNAPYQPFHTDRRVTLHVYAPPPIVYTPVARASPKLEPKLEPAEPSTSVLLDFQAKPEAPTKPKKSSKLRAAACPALAPAPAPAPTSTPPAAENASSWVFGQPISSVKLNTGLTQHDEDDSDTISEALALPSSALSRVTTKIPNPDEDFEQIVITTKIRRGVNSNGHSNGNSQVVDDDGFFEDDMDVIDFASQRV